MIFDSGLSYVVMQIYSVLSCEYWKYKFLNLFARVLAYPENLETRLTISSENKLNMLTSL